MGSIMMTLLPCLGLRLFSVVVFAFFAYYTFPFSDGVRPAVLCGRCAGAWFIWTRHQYQLQPWMQRANCGIQRRKWVRIWLRIAFHSVINTLHSAFYASPHAGCSTHPSPFWTLVPKNLTFLFFTRPKCFVLCNKLTQYLSKTMLMQYKRTFVVQ